MLCGALIVAGALCANHGVAGEDESRTLFAEGRKLRMAGNCPDAIVAFRRAHEAWPEGLGSLRNIAECQQELGLLASARRSWWSLRREVLRLQQEKYAGWVEDAERAHAALEERVPRLTVVVRGAPVEHFAVEIDGEALEPGLLGVAVEQDIGTHAVVVTRGSEVLARREITLAAGDQQEATFAIEPPPVELAPNAVRVAGYVTLAVGGAGVAAMVSALVARQIALGRVEDACPSLVDCDPSVQADVDSGELASLLFNVFLGVGAAATATGVTLVLVGDEEPVELGFVPIVAPRAGNPAAGVDIGGVATMRVTLP